MQLVFSSDILSFGVYFVLERGLSALRKSYNGGRGCYKMTVKTTPQHSQRRLHEAVKTMKPFLEQTFALTDFSQIRSVLIS